MDYVNLAGRILIGFLFFGAGMGKVTGYEGTAAMMASVGLPGMLLPLVILLEVGGAIAIMIGWQTRWVSLALAVFCGLSAVLFHADFSDPNQMANFMKNLALVGGFLLLYANGAGPLSLDERKAAATT